MLEHIIRLASQAGNKQFETLDRVTQNVANINTPGYKGKRFEQFLRTDGAIGGTEQADFSKGPISITRRELDVAIDGHGFIPVTQPDGSIAYTRAGNFTRNSEGYLITQFGDLVGDGIQLPVNYDKLIISETGEIKVKYNDKLEPEKVGQLKLVNFANPEGLKSIGSNKLVPTADSGEPTLAEARGIRQGALERANVSVFHEIDQVLRLNAGVMSNMRIVKFADDIYRQAVNLRQ